MWEPADRRTYNGQTKRVIDTVVLLLTCTSIMFFNHIYFGFIIQELVEGAVKILAVYCYFEVTLSGREFTPTPEKIKCMIWKNCGSIICLVREWGGGGYFSLYIPNQ